MSVIRVRDNSYKVLYGDQLQKGMYVRAINGNGTVYLVSREYDGTDEDLRLTNIANGTRYIIRPNSEYQLLEPVAMEFQPVRNTE